MNSVITLIPYKALPNDDLEEDYSQKHIQLGIGQQVLGRGDFLSISDKRVSRSQATLTVEPEDDKMKITLKRLGMNAMFVVRNDGKWIPLEKEQEIKLQDGDCFSMCVREFMFRIKEEQNDGKPPSQPAVTQEDSQLQAKKANDAKPQVEPQKKVKQPIEEPQQEGWLSKKKKEPKPQSMEVEIKEHFQEQTKGSNNNQDNKQRHSENEANEMKESNSQDSDAKKNKRKITEEESDEEEYVNKVQKQIEKHQSTEDVSKNKKQKIVEPVVEDDEALARRLQKELEEEDKQPKKKNTKKPNTKKPVEEDDEEIAKKLQKELEQEEAEQLKKDAKLAKALAKGHKHSPSKGKNMTYKSGRPRRLCTLKQTKYEDDQVFSSGDSWDEAEDSAASSASSEAEDWNSQDSGADEAASQSGSDGEYKAAKKTKKPMCQYGADCYRTNPDHLKAFRHPKKKQK